MIKCIKAVLVFVVSIQIAYAGSANLPSIFSGNNLFNVIERQQLDINFFIPQRQSLIFSLGGEGKHRFAQFPSRNSNFWPLFAHQYLLGADRNNRHQLAIGNLARVHQTAQYKISGKQKKMGGVASDLSVNSAGDMFLDDENSNTEEHINKIRDISFMTDKAVIGSLSDYSSSRVGDINGDGFDEWILTNGKVVFVVYGDEGSYFKKKLIDLNNFTEVQGFKIQFYNEDYRISAVSGAGKVNNDNLDDIIIGVANADSESGSSYVLYGRQEKKTGIIKLSEENISSDLGFIIKGAAAGDKSGSSVMGAGDINCDGFDDVIVEASGVINGGSVTGASYVVYGQENNPEVIYLSSFHTADYAGFMFAGDNKKGRSDYGVTNAPAINRDSCDDLIIGRAYAGADDNQDSDVGYVVYWEEDGHQINNLGGLGYLKGSIPHIINFDALNADRLTHADSDILLYPGAFKDDSINHLKVADDVALNVVPKIAVDFNTISSEKDAYGRDFVSFNGSAINSHYLQLDHQQLNGLEQFTIQIDFELNFKRDYKKIQHAYLLSLATKSGTKQVRDNMLSIYLKDRNKEYLYSKGGFSGRWDLSVVLEDKENNEHQIFLNKNWIGQKRKITLTVAVNLSNNPQTIKVYRNDNDSITHGHTHLWDQKVVVNQIEQPEGESVYQFTTDITELTVDPKGAYFGNDQDMVGGEFNQEQAFEGKLYGLRIYNKMFDPRETHGHEYLQYSVSEDSIVFKQ